jgi:BMFP domain-containing protein YqiC
MSQSRNSLVEEFARLASDAAGVATGMRREAETLLKTQLERLLSTMDMVTREEHEAVKEMAAAARDENERLAARIAALEARLDLKA